MNILSAALALHNNEYRSEGSRELFQQMKENRLVAVFGASDDLAELRGAIEDEAGGSKFYVTRKGILVSECREGDRCPYFKKSLATADWIEPLWCEPGEPSWTYRTNFPSASFDINEDGEPYCRGIVFSLDSLKE